ncbi:MAG: EF-hand domain-containing protein [Gammaproteobacteria bacterium]|jgi:Ca2+-binding EF-hand superfamily protein
MRNDKAAEIKENFDYFDRDGNGRIDFGEFVELMNALNAELTNDQARLGFESLDTDENGQIDLAEFQAWWANK